MVRIEEMVSSGSIAPHVPNRAILVTSPVESVLDFSYDDPLTKRNFKEGNLTFRDLDEIFSEFEVE